MFQLTQPLALSYGFVGTTDTTDITLADNKWHHISVVWDGTECQLRLYHRAANYCEPDPCHGHKCLDKLDGFVCHCGRGFTGETCDIPPDYCLHNLCLNGASCLSGSASYTCQCTVGFRGRYCQEHIVNGGYGPWSAWSSCTKTCEVGAQSRSRQCNDPVPDLDGLPCVGLSSETQDCNKDKCPGCVEFTSFRGLLHATVECSQASDGDTLCHVSCEAGMKPIRAISNPYICGPSTEFVWSHQLRNPRARLPSCARSAVPERAVLKVGATYSVNSSDMLQPMETHLTTLMENNPCGQSRDCNVSISVNQVNGGNRVRRDTNSAFQGLLVVTATTLHIDYFPNNTLDVYAEATAMANWAYIVDNLMGVALSIEAAANSGNMSITVDGVTYAPSKAPFCCEESVSALHLWSLLTYTRCVLTVPLAPTAVGEVVSRVRRVSTRMKRCRPYCRRHHLLTPMRTPMRTPMVTPMGTPMEQRQSLLPWQLQQPLSVLSIATVVVVIECLHRNTVSTNGDVVTRRAVTPRAVTPHVVTLAVDPSCSDPSGSDPQ
ncbi:hypothetical protein LSAT2_004578 [Lamellibrachia satsuma]|nr:hypothetical protein LSAT2_004578 [Lamellibrachia satsuma]